ncbi:hypothetical protein YC2023_036274 [Brassica napus]|uniref:(rape) hypothetical protein n=1 Tax=Brassica napus TaxID=3708 RepID=A0A816I7P2_BRANA|nr:unnamed protein product [Brassica napus]
MITGVAEGESGAAGSSPRAWPETKKKKLELAIQARDRHDDQRRSSWWLSNCRLRCMRAPKAEVRRCEQDDLAVEIWSGVCGCGLEES